MHVGSTPVLAKLAQLVGIQCSRMAGGMHLGSIPVVAKLAQLVGIQCSWVRVLTMQANTPQSDPFLWSGIF